MFELASIPKQPAMRRFRPVASHASFNLNILSSAKSWTQSDFTPSDGSAGIGNNIVNAVGFELTDHAAERRQELVVNALELCPRQRMLILLVRIFMNETARMISLSPKHTPKMR
jgi:hypothetical protein